MRSLGTFDLVTGTPPYLPIGTAGESRRVQKAACNLEYRGGIEAYCAAAAIALDADGVFVACEQAAQTARVEAAARAVGLAITHTLPVVPRAGKAPLFAVHTMRRTGTATMLPPSSRSAARGSGGGCAPGNDRWVSPVLAAGSGGPATLGRRRSAAR